MQVREKHSSRAIRTSLCKMNTFSLLFCSIPAFALGNQLRRVEAVADQLVVHRLDAGVAAARHHDREYRLRMPLLDRIDEPDVGDLPPQLVGEVLALVRIELAA